MMTTIFRHLIPAAALCATPALAQQFENLDLLDERIAAVLGAPMGEAGGAATRLDRRLRLAACPQPAQIGDPIGGAVTVQCQAIGWRIRVPLAGGGANHANAPVPQVAAVRAEPVVRRGDQVELIAVGRAFSVSTLAVAEQDGAPGDRIRVRTERRSAPVFGMVRADGRVTLPGFN